MSSVVNCAYALPPRGFCVVSVVCLEQDARSAAVVLHDCENMFPCMFSRHVFTLFSRHSVFSTKSKTSCSGLGLEVSRRWHSRITPCAEL